jgi:hypothetical protein
VRKTRKNQFFHFASGEFVAHREIHSFHLRIFGEFQKFDIH